MSKTSHQANQPTSAFESVSDPVIDPTRNFDLWAGAVKQQMLAALRKREGVRNAQG